MYSAELAAAVHALQPLLAGSRLHNPIDSSLALNTMNVTEQTFLIDYFPIALFTFRLAAQILAVTHTHTSIPNQTRVCPLTITHMVTHTRTHSSTPSNTHTHKILHMHTH